MASPARQGPQSRKRKVFIVDGCSELRESLVCIINQQTELKVCGESEGGSTVLRDLAASRPDVVVVEASSHAADVVELLKTIRAKEERLPILVYAMNADPAFAQRIVQSGANGYVGKDAPQEHVVDAIRRLLRGERYLDKRFIVPSPQDSAPRPVSARNAPLEDLSDREWEVFKLIGQGHSTRQIAELLHISAKTVESYQAHIKEKLSLRNARELVQHAIEWTLTNERQ